MDIADVGRLLIVGNLSAKYKIVEFEACYY